MECKRLRLNGPNEKELKVIKLSKLSRNKQNDFSKMGQPLIKLLLNNFALNKFKQEAISISHKHGGSLIDEF